MPCVISWMGIVSVEMLYICMFILGMICYQYLKSIRVYNCYHDLATAIILQLRYAVVNLLFRIYHETNSQYRFGSAKTSV